ncbi:MAG: phasin family protein [Betaproteobacteria bacterium]|jgi:phasin family protein|nr:phasin family protein [Betaproteobacteria bacterium]
MIIFNPNGAETMKNVNEQIAEIAKTNVDTAVELSGAAMTGVEKLVDLQLKVAKTAMSQGADNLKALASAKDVQELMKVQSSFAMPTIETAVSYANAIYGIASETANTFAKMAESQISASNQKISTAVEEFSKNAPAGSESGVALVKSALTAANAAYETASKAAKQAVAVVEQNVQSATKAGVKAATTALKAA